MHISECQNTRWWVTHWVMMEKQEDRFPQGTKCSLCPLPHVHHQLHNLYLYTSPLETVSSGVIYWFNRSFFMFASNWFRRMYVEAAQRKQHTLLQTEWDSWLKKGSPHLVHVSLHVCSYEGMKWGSRERGEKINKDMEHIKLQCWVVRLTHWFSAVTYSVKHWMVDKVNKIETSVQLPGTAKPIKSQGTQNRERLRVWEHHVTVYKMRPGRSETLKQPISPWKLMDWSWKLREAVNIRCE